MKSASDRLHISIKSPPPERPSLLERSRLHRTNSSGVIRPRPTEERPDDCLNHIPQEAVCRDVEEVPPHTSSHAACHPAEVCPHLECLEKVVKRVSGGEILPPGLSRLASWSFLCAVMVSSAA